MNQRDWEILFLMNIKNVKGKLVNSRTKPKKQSKISIQIEWNIKQSAWIFILQGSTGRLQSSSSNQFVRDKKITSLQINHNYTQNTQYHTYILERNKKIHHEMFAIVLIFFVFFFVHSVLVFAFVLIRNFRTIFEQLDAIFTIYI